MLTYHGIMITSYNTYQNKLLSSITNQLNVVIFFLKNPIKKKDKKNSSQP